MPLSMTKLAANKTPAPPPAAADVGEAKPKGQTLKLTKPAAATKKPKPGEAAPAPEAAITPEPVHEPVEVADTPSQSVPATVSVETANNLTKESGEESKIEHVEVPVPAPVRGTPCMVRYDLGYTHNLGNYCSAKGVVSISIPCKREDIDATADFAKDWCDARLTTLAEELQAMSDEPAE